MRRLVHEYFFRVLPALEFMGAGVPRAGDTFAFADSRFMENAHKEVSQTRRFDVVTCTATRIHDHAELAPSTDRAREEAVTDRCSQL